MTAMRFRDRAQGGRRLALRLVRFHTPDVVVVGLAGGGMQVAYEIARALDAPLDVVVVRKLRVPSEPTLAIGAVAEDGRTAFNYHLMERMGVRAHELADLVAREIVELDRGLARYRAVRAPIPLTGKTAIVVDDGLSTGATARAAVEVVRRRGAAKIVLAAPVASRDLVRSLRDVADEVVCVETPPFITAIKGWYAGDGESSEEENVALLERAGREWTERTHAFAASS